MNTTNFHYWLTRHFGGADFTLTPLAGDASLRRYFRVQRGKLSWVAMDASAEQDRCHQFIAIANALRAKALDAPEIFAQDIQSGYLLLSDFGDDLYLKKLNNVNMEVLYARALDALAVLSTVKEVKDYQIPFFTADFMRQELSWFQEWFLEKHIALELSQEIKLKLGRSFDLLAAGCASQHQVFMHRDYHSANLMVLPGNQIGILDFQDAFIGPVTYDLVSLLRDCYISWPNELVEKLALQYRDKIRLSISDAEFVRWFDWMGIQRHLKALMTFSRKFRRDMNPGYLQHIPRTLNYILQGTERYPEFSMLNTFLREQVLGQIECAP